MAITLSGRNGLILENMKTMLSEVSAFQTWVGAVDATAALDSIFVMTADADSVTRPFAVIMPGNGGRISRSDNTGSFRPWPDSFQVMIAFENDVDSNYTSDAENAWKSMYEDIEGSSGIVDGILDLSWIDDNLCLSFAEPNNPYPRRNDEELTGEKGDWFQWIWTFGVALG